MSNIEMENCRAWIAIALKVASLQDLYKGGIEISWHEIIEITKANAYVILECMEALKRDMEMGLESQIK